MDSRKILLLASALVVAAVTAFLARSLIVGAPTPQAAAIATAAPVSGPEVLVATRALPVGTILDATALKYQPWPKELVENAYFIRQGNFDAKSLQGTVVRNPITAGQPITQGALVKPGDRGFLAAALGPGMRAVTVPVSQQSSVAGFVFPGDRIDLVLTQNVVGGGDGPPLKVAETVMRNLRVLATDQRTDNSVDETGKTQVRSFSMVTLEATPKLAEQIAVVQTLGQLSLSLRSLADNPSELEQAIASGAVNVPDGNDPKAEKAMIAKVAAQPSAGSLSYETGADVSRFQRRTVPGKPVDATAPGGAVALAKGPVVRIARGNTVTDVAVGGKK
ncbi:Flp pilus assembly protein CpaB [Sphingomonas sp. H39-1-10]|uniref:Flp pilus assembly protein CpaB n=1 Tax=Sphingomonas pollutisoli TaxID=3030829 RepID=UPI0023B97CE2|nr:Flp pilus assembly protein CpaB [Sphingomonas pollutisoli]MDF0488480.1 Flp pilus assembly protein CpaB [Sphingomonas pollutisoli]